MQFETEKKVGKIQIFSETGVFFDKLWLIEGVKEWLCRVSALSASLFCWAGAFGAGEKRAADRAES